MQITSGKIPSAQKIVVYGPEGVGKSTMAAMFPGAVFIDVEGSTDDMDVPRLPKPESWTMLLETVRFAIVNCANVGTLIVDTADWAERLCIQHVCATYQANSIETVAGGYGKGYTILAEEFGNLLNLLSDAAERGVNVALTAHANVRKFEQPDEMTAYDRWGLKLTNTKAGNGTAGIVKEWAKTVLFMTYKTIAVKNEAKTAKGQGGKHVLYTSHHPAYDAKNRAGLPEEIDIEGIKALPKVLADLFVAKPAVVAPTAKAAPKQTPTEKAIADMGATIIGTLPAVTKEQPTLPDGSMPAHLKSLHQLMAEGSATEEDVRHAVAEQGYFPLNTPLEKYPTDFVEGVLIAKWEAVLGVINESKIAAAPIR